MAGDPNGTNYLYKSPNIKITSRDLGILSSIAYNQSLTTSQLAVLHFSSLHRARKRLCQLHENKYVTRIKIPAGLETLSSELVYTIRKRGLQLLQLQGQVDDSIPIPQLSRRPGALLFLSHTLLRNSFKIAIQCAVKRHPEITMSNWAHDNSVTRFAILADTKTQSMKRTTLKADALFTLQRNESELECFLEVDNGTMTLTRLASKMSAYRKWHLADVYNPPRKVCWRRFLILTFSERRARNIANKLRSISVAGENYLVSYVDRQEILNTDVLKRPLWFRPSNKEPRKISLEEDLLQNVARQEVTR